MLLLSTFSFVVSVCNSLNVQRQDEPVVFPIGDKSVSAVVVTCDGKEIASQIDDLNGDGVYDEVCFLADLKAKETKQYQITYYDERAQRQYPSRVYAELLLRKPRLQKRQEPESAFIRELTFRGDVDSYSYCQHHGVAFESELCAFRIYFDKRQTIDAWGKNKRQLELEATQFYPTAEQKQQGYGDDVLWVGNTFGAGCLRGWNGKPLMIEPTAWRTQRVIATGPLRTIVDVVDEGWQPIADKQPITMTTRYTMYAGHRDVQIDAIYNKVVSDYQFSTGVINIPNSTKIKSEGLRACWGTASPSGKNDTIAEHQQTVGLAAFVPKQYLAGTSDDDPDNLTLVMATPTKSLRYYIAFAYKGEEVGIGSAKEWKAWLENWKKRLLNPVIKVFPSEK